MSTPHETYQELMVDALFGEIAPEDRARLEAHLSTCDACAETFESLQATLAVTAERERPDRPPSFWREQRARLNERLAAETGRPPSLSDRVRRWWASLPLILPQTGPQWALQGAVALVLLGIGLWAGTPDAPTATEPPPLAQTHPAPAAGNGLSDLLLARQPVQGDFGRARPAIAGVEDITYDVTEGTVEIRYNTVTDVVVRGAPEDPKIQRLLEAALLDDRNPSSRLHAVKTLEQSAAPSDDEVVRALRYVAREESAPDMQLRAVRALRALHTQRPMSDATRDVLVGALLDGASTALRIEALQALTAAASPDGAVPAYVYQIRNDTSAYLRHRAEQMLQQIGAPSTRDLP